jgi:hypothetical protein
MDRTEEGADLGRVGEGFPSFRVPNVRFLAWTCRPEVGYVVSGVFQHTPVFYPGLWYSVNGQPWIESSTKQWKYRGFAYIEGL